MGFRDTVLSRGEPRAEVTYHYCIVKVVSFEGVGRRGDVVAPFCVSRICSLGQGEVEAGEGFYCNGVRAKEEEGCHSGRRGGR